MTREQVAVIDELIARLRTYDLSLSRLEIPGVATLDLIPSPTPALSPAEKRALDREPQTVAGRVARNLGIKDD